MSYNLSIRGWMSENELKVIEQWCLELPANSTIVEVGSFYGRSAACFAMSAPTSTVFCYDRWFSDPVINNSHIPIEICNIHGFPLTGMINSYENFLNNTKDLPNIISKKIIQSADINWEGGKSIDLFFIDAEHKNPSDWEYITYWIPFIKTGSYICGHDYYVDGPDKDRFLDINTNIKKLESMFGTTVETYKNGSLWRIKIT